MKTIILTIAAIILSSVNAFAANDSKTITYTNHSQNQRDYIVLDSESMKPLVRTVYNTDGSNISKTTYHWSEKNGWNKINQTAYTKGKNNYPQSINYTEWKMTKDEKSRIIKQLSHIYAQDNDLLASMGL